MEEGWAHQLNVSMVAVAKPSMSFLMMCSVKEPYPRYKQIILGTEYRRHCGEEISTKVVERRLSAMKKGEMKKYVLKEKEDLGKEFMKTCGMK